VSADAMRAYIRRRRGLLGYTQEGLASAIGMPHSTYRDYESGSTQELKAGLFVQIVGLLNIPLEHIKRLGKQITVAEADQLAYEWLTRTERDEIDRFAASIADDQVAHALALIEQLQADPSAILRLRGYLEGLVEEYLEDQQKEQTKGQSKPRP
jgi:transcriptional regulator with XRE-family HTH domain